MTCSHKEDVCCQDQIEDSVLWPVDEVPDVGTRDGVDGHLRRFEEHIKEGLLAASCAIGLEILAEKMEADVTELAGPKGKHLKNRTAKRHGTESGSVTLGGRQVGIDHPRVRTADNKHEIPVPTYAAATNTDLLAEGVVARMLAGLSTRRYRDGLEPVGAGIDAKAKSTSKSAISRRFVDATSDRLDDLLRRRLEDKTFVVVYLDGFNLGEHLLVGALGVVEDGTKLSLGVVEGTTENAEVCTRLVADLADRGLDASRGILFVVDGSKALSKAIRAVFGNKAVIQRCRLHKERNIERHLPAAEWEWVKPKLRDAWAEPDHKKAKAALEALARALETKRPGAAGSLRDGLDETIAINRLGVGQATALWRSLASTNPIESMIDIIKDHAIRVKRWRDGKMALRWAAAGMICAQDQFRRLRGHKQLPLLQQTLAQAIATNPNFIDQLEEAA